MWRRSQSGLAVVGSFLYLHEADVARALLDSYGIETWVLDEHQIRQRWHLAGPLGGVKVAVAPEHASRARSLLEQDHSEALEDLEEQRLPAHPDELCPRCQQPAVAERVHPQAPGPLQWLTVLAFVPLGVLVPRRRVVVERRCGACTHVWSVRESR